LPPDDAARHETSLPTGKEWQSREHDTGPEHHQFDDAGPDQTSLRKSQHPGRRSLGRILVTGAVIAMAYILLESSFTDIHNVPESAQTESRDPGTVTDSFTENQAESSAPP